MKLKHTDTETTKHHSHLISLQQCRRGETGSISRQRLWLATSGILVLLAMIFILPARAAAASQYKVLHTFTGGKDGGSPDMLIFDAAGNLYGTAGGGTGEGNGTVFELVPNSDGSWTENTLYTFCSLKNCTDGFAPNGALAFDPAGNLYGTAEEGGDSDWGVVFELTPHTGGQWTEAVLYSFKGGTDGKSPDGVIFDATGNLYGTTREGGTSGYGTVFKLTPNSDGTWTESILYNFCSLTNCTDGLSADDLTFDQSGNLYGTTPAGGVGCNGDGCGVVYQLKPNSNGSWTEIVLYSFTGAADGATPFSGVTFDAAGNLYGTTTNGGNLKCINEGIPGCGVVFQLKPNSDGSWTESVLHNFADHPASRPTSRLLFDESGNLYGTTSDGGSANAGTVFKIAPNSDGRWAFKVLHVFAGKPASSPNSLIEKTGNFYGSTGLCLNEKKCAGVVFELIP
jgi:uncharacterized repeat protein (TIGR03803 family)